MPSSSRITNGFQQGVYDIVSASNPGPSNECAIPLFQIPLKVITNVHLKKGYACRIPSIQSFLGL